MTIQRNVVSGAVGGSAVRLFGAPNTNVSVLTNTFTGNAFGIRIDSGALVGELEAHFNRIAGSGTGAANDDPDVGDFVDAENNWWGCSEGPGLSGCDSVVGNVDADPWLILALSASPTAIAATGTSQITASLTRNSDNVNVGAGFPNGTPIAFSATLGTVGSPRMTSGGVASTTFTAAGQAGTGTVTAALDNEATQTALSIGAPAAGTEAAAKPKKCKKKKFREKHPKLCGKGKKANKGKKRKRR